MSKFNHEVAAQIAEYLESEKWHFDFDEDNGIFSFGMHIDSRLKTIRYYIKVNMNDYSVYGIAPVSANPEDRDEMLSMAEFICRANYGLRVGAFEMDMEDGELRYHTSVYFKGITLASPVIERSIYMVARMFEHYGQGILSVLFGGKDAKAAYDECEEEIDGRLEAARKAIERLRASLPLDGGDAGDGGDEADDDEDIDDEDYDEDDGEDFDGDDDGDEDDELPMDVFDEQDGDE